MNVLGRFTVIPELPAPLNPLLDLASNLWWSWHPEAQQLFEELNPQAWKRFRKNPIKVLLETDPQRLDALAQEPAFLGRLQAVVERFQSYLRDRASLSPDIAYFSMEFGFHESLPIYAGGLGILAGDHIKSASDLKIPLVGVGLFFHQGYFHQEIDEEGRQKEFYEELVPAELPLDLVRGTDGRALKIQVELLGGSRDLIAYRVRVGGVAVYLLSADLPENPPEVRQITARLYAPGQEMRIQQEILLGIGGVRLLRALGLAPKVWHMNEGHAAFITLERIRERVAEGVPFAEAREAVRASTLFTTHTPVPAGHDRFSLELIGRYLGGWWDHLGISYEEFIRLGEEQLEGGRVFSMSNLALRLSAAANGVSALHGAVSRQMFHHFWEGLEEEEVPIGSVNNGVHLRSILHPRLAELYAQSFGLPEEDQVPTLWATERLPEGKLWKVKAALREELVKEVRERLYAQRWRNGESPARLRQAERVLDPGVLTIGFARRFATYKRALLLFKDPERLKKIFEGPYPLQVLFAGKAHPSDEPGKQSIQKLIATIRELGLDDRILFLENYDLALARQLVQGVDLWMNTPRRPLEASGTSGMKAALNGALNFSVLDGWWAEAYNGRNGWRIGDDRSYASEEIQDLADAQSLYDTLEHEILPLFYARGADGIPSGWLSMVRESIRSGGVYTASRMVLDYVSRYYEPIQARVRTLEGRLTEVVRWQEEVERRWPEVRLRVEAPVTSFVDGAPIEVEAWLWPAGLAPEDLRVELVTRRSRGGLEVIPLELEASGEELKYRLSYRPSQPGSYVYGIRVVAVHPWLSRFKVRWAS
jgi:starch phosphorylase